MTTATKQSRSRIALILRRLERVFGPVKPPEQLPVLDELIATILSQNTTDSNSGAAFTELRRRFRDWKVVRRASVERVADAIRIAGLVNQKAPRIKAVFSANPPTLLASVATQRSRGDESTTPE